MAVISEALSKFGGTFLEGLSAQLQAELAAGKISRREVSELSTIGSSLARLLGTPEDVISRAAPDAFLVAPHPRY